MAKQDLRGKVVAVTGGARGIGLQIAKALVEQGAQVAIGDIDEKLAQAAARPLGAHAAKLDVRDRESFAAFLDSARQELGPIDVLVNNAGIMPMGAFLDEPAELSTAQIDINFRGVIHGMQLALPEMLARGSGHIVNIASLAGRFGIPGAVVYTGTKFAVVGLTEAADAEYRGRGVHFTAVMPSKVRTELAAGTEAAGKGIPAVGPEDVAAAVVQALRRPQLFVAVPAFLKPAAAVMQLAPEWLIRLGRRAIGDNRILSKLDRGERRDYERRLDALAQPAAKAVRKKVRA
ncbi:SDR family oxidoreductase [Solimonas sp. K1W22B-7]|uniref:SDR family oxidoreductase n=1 Tax=Solimonas sp. K1W22B-7 TaxID=2303331 RepID=UPI000E337B26|nr:SDR family oxidoreductase [Solimonas sp. K1W22B-7]AXQ30157.1 SDR family oxidoreductase [Solimonas sp. K1W22B-7]